MVKLLTRRRLLAGAGLAATVPVRGTVLTGEDSPESRRDLALKLRVDAATAQAGQAAPPQSSNGDETTLPRWIASSTKGLPHSQFGEVEPGTYETLLHAIETGKQADFEAIARGSGRRFVSPQSSYAFTMEGGDSHRFAVAPAPGFSSQEAAADMNELYWQALCRDVPFAEYHTSLLTRQAADSLGLTPRTLFRGPTQGDLEGPYISQLLVKPVETVSTLFEQRYRTPAPGNDFVTTFGEWLQIQNGVPPWRDCFWDSTPRYIRNGRDLAEWVHYDFLYQAFLNGALILMNYRPEAVLNENRTVLSQMNPYRRSQVQDGFVTFGLAQVVDWLGRVTTAALKATWRQKWLVHRRLRPEAYGGRVHQTKTNAVDYPIHARLLASPSLEETFRANGSYLLSQAYPEASPLHPSYPGGHGTVAGACSVVLKAFFDESALIPDCVHASADGLSLLPCAPSFTPTIGNEVDKLAFNVAMGRDWAGIHYRSDAVAGMRLGEDVAISILQDLVRCCTEDFDGFSFTRLDGSSVRINRDGELAS
jgi:hypothetical protein